MTRSAAIAADRAALGDTFALESGAMTYLFVFSASGVKAFYDIAESDASKGIADMRMLSRKVPADLFFDRRTIPHDMFTRELAESYVANVGDALDVEVALLGDAGEIDVFDLTRRLGHRFGLASRGGPGAAAGDVFTALVDALDRLDASAAFVTPEAAAEIAANDHAEERAALDEIAAAYRSIVAAHDTGPVPGMFATIVDRWADDDERIRGIAHDVALVHLGSMSNLFAAAGWSIVHLAQRPELAARVAGGDRGFAERCALESTRLAQRSIMLRIEARDPDRMAMVRPLQILGPVRPGGTAALLRGAPDADLVLVTHVGLESLQRLAKAPARIPFDEPVRIYLTRIRRSEIPDGDRFIPWLDAQWAACDRRLRDRASDFYPVVGFEHSGIERHS